MYLEAENTISSNLNFLGDCILRGYSSFCCTFTFSYHMSPHLIVMSFMSEHSVIYMTNFNITCVCEGGSKAVSYGTI